MPGPWRTSLPDERSPVFALMVFAGLVALGRFGWQSKQRGLMAAAAVLLGLQAWGTLGLRLTAAQALITFGGDGGCLVLGSLLMAAFYLRLDGAPHWGELRWGFLAIGSVSFADALDLWWRARSDGDAIPFGEIEGVGFSDPSKLTEVFGWSTTRMVSSYVGLGMACLLVLALIYAAGLVRARGRARA